MEMRCPHPMLAVGPELSLADTVGSNPPGDSEVKERLCCADSLVFDENHLNIFFIGH